MTVSVGSETMLDLLEAETKIPAIKSALTNNSAKHDLTFLEDIGSPDDCIMTNQEPIDVGSMHILVDQRRIEIRQYVLTTNRSIP